MYKYVVGLSARDGTMYFYVPNMVFGTIWVIIDSKYI
jgi:hypothetical protein